MMGGKRKELTREQKNTILRLWPISTYEEIMKETGLSRDVIKGFAYDMKLGQKPRATNKATPRKAESQLEKVEQSSMTDFLSMLDSCYEILKERRLDLIQQLDQLEGLGIDNKSISQRVAGINKELSEVEELLVVATDRLNTSSFLRKRTQAGIATMGGLLDYCGAPEQREKEGIKMGKMKVAMDKVQAQWQEANEFSINDVDAIYLCPEMFDENKQEGACHEEKG